MNIVVKEGVRVNVKATRRIMKERGFRFRIFKNNPRRFSVFLNRKGREMYNNDIEAMMNIVFAFERDEIGRWSRDDLAFGNKVARSRYHSAKSTGDLCLRSPHAKLVVSVGTPKIKTKNEEYGESRI